MLLSFDVLLRPAHRLRDRFLPAGYALRRAGLARLSFAAVGRVALASWLFRAVFDGRLRWSGIARYEAGRADHALARGAALSTMSAGVREAWIDRRFHAGGTDDPCPPAGLDEAADAIARRIGQIRAREPARPVILSPFHYVSQYANVAVVDRVRRALGLASISLVSGVPRDLYGDDHATIPSIRVLYTYGEGSRESRNGLGLRLSRALRRDGLAVIFADVPPYTFVKYPMETVGVSMRGRAARIHHGVFRLGAPLDALLLPFYLTFERGRFGIRIFEPIALAQADAPQRLADDIEVALAENYPHWLFAGHPCVYHFAATR